MAGANPTNQKIYFGEKDGNPLEFWIAGRETAANGGTVSDNGEIMTLYQEKQAYWNALYNPFIGRLQAQLYNWYLKGNRIPTGTANYSEVISLIISESML